MHCHKHRRGPAATRPPRACRLAGPGALAVIGLAAGVHAQEVAQKPTPTLVLAPQVVVDETLTSNHNRGTTGTADSITRVSAGIGLRAQPSPRLSAYLDYILTESIYLRNSSENLLQHNLNSSMLGRWLDGRVELAAGATYNRRSLSPFASSGSQGTRSNSTPQFSWRVAPAVNGLITPDVAYNARVSYTETRVQGQALGDNRIGQAGLRVLPNRGGRLQMLGDIDHVTADYPGGRRVTSDRLYATGTYQLTDMDLRLGANAGQEYSDLLTASRTRYNTWGLSAVWAPSPRTRLDAAYGNRSFGRAYQLSADYRTPFTVWRISGLRDVSYASGSAQLPGSRAPALTLFYNVLANTGLSDADRLLRAVQLLDRLGESYTQPLDAKYLTGSATLDSSVQLSAAWRGPRDTALLQIGRSQSRRIDPLAAVLDLLGIQGSVSTRQLQLSLSHQLTPEASVLLSANTTASDNDRGTQRLRQWQLSTGLDVKLSPHVNATLGLRHGRYDVQSTSSTESAVTASILARY